jgi:dUTP pyrophosphatase
MNVRIKRLRLGAVIPELASKGAAGMDVACAEGTYTIYPGQHALIPTGLAFEIPYGHEMQIRPRSGLALKNRVTVLNSPSTIDADYRGEVGVVLINHGSEEFVVEPGDRIAQIVIAPVTRVTFVESDTLSDTARGQGGFGSTGK